MTTTVGAGEGRGPVRKIFPPIVAEFDHFAQGRRRLNWRVANADLHKVIAILRRPVTPAAQCRGSTPMEHVVFYPGPDAAPAFRRFSSLDEAVRFVEHLRSGEGVHEVSVHTLTPVPVAFRAYYKAEISAGELASGLVPDQAPAPVEPVLEVVPAEVPAELVAEMPAAEPVLAEMSAELPAEMSAEPEVAQNGKRSLGFFSH
jgi:hypothetical protein